jgi:hypothetical protein
MAVPPSVEDEMSAKKSVWAMVFPLVLACGAETTEPGQAAPPEAQTPPVSAPAPDSMDSAIEGVVDPSVAQCLDLVRANKFGEAIPVCTRAQQAEPENTDVKGALENARAEFEKAQADEAKARLEQAAAEKSSALEDAKKGLAGRIPD